MKNKNDRQLGLAPFEHYMFADDTATWPMTCNLHLHYRGEIDIDRLTRALHQVLPLHPLLNSVVVGGARSSRTSKLSWVKSSIPPEILVLKDEMDPTANTPLDISASPGLRILVFNEATPSYIKLQWHHCACDGLGIFSFFETLLARYRELSPGSNPAFVDHPATLVEACIEQLGIRAVNPQRFWRRLRSQPHQLNRIVRFFTNRVRLIGSEKHREASATSAPWYSGLEWQMLSREISEAVMTEAKNRSVSLNDWLLACYYRSLSEVLLGAEGSTKGCLRVAVPISLRYSNTRLTEAPVQETAMNRVSMIFMDRQQSEIECPTQLLQSIQREMSQVKKWELGWALLDCLAIAGRVPGGVQQLTHEGRSPVTSVFSNLVQPFTKSDLANQLGELETDDFTITAALPFAPLRSGLAIGVDVLTYAKRLTVTAHYNTGIVSPLQAQHLVETFLRIASQQQIVSTTPSGKASQEVSR